MADQEIRAALDAHWAASDANDFELEHQIYPIFRRCVRAGTFTHSMGRVDAVRRTTAASAVKTALQ